MGPQFPLARQLSLQTGLHCRRVGCSCGVFTHCHSVTLWRDVDHVRASSSEQLAEGVIQMAVTDAAEVVERDTSEPEARRPLMTRSSILMMNVGFFGVQYSFGLTQTAVNPLFTLIGATPEELPILNLAGPVTSLLIQPLIGAVSDRHWSDRWGRCSGAVLKDERSMARRPLSLLCGAPSST